MTPGGGIWWLAGLLKSLQFVQAFVVGALMVGAMAGQRVQVGAVPVHFDILAVQSQFGVIRIVLCGLRGR
jgi:hypothetical protein